MHQASTSIDQIKLESSHKNMVLNTEQAQIVCSNTPQGTDMMVDASSSRGTVNARKIEVNDMLRTATSHLASANHPSTKFPPMWMPKPSIWSNARKVVQGTICLASMSTFAWLSTLQGLPIPVLVVLLCIFPFILLGCSIFFCSMYPFEYIEVLNFRGLQIINTGAIIKLVMNYLGGIYDGIGMFIGTALLSFGTIVFSYCTMILGPWEFMVASPLLAIGLLLQTTAALVPLIDSNRMNGNTSANLGLASCPFLFIALAFFVKKAYQMLRLPVLGSQNFRFIGVIFYGGSLISNAILNIVQALSKGGISSDAYDLALAVTSSFAFYGTSVFLLDGNRVKNHCDAMIENRFPSTTYLVRHKTGFIISNVSCTVAILANLAMTVRNLVGVHDQDVFEFATKALTSLALVAIAGFAMYPSLLLANKSKEYKVECVILRVICGFTTLAVGLFVSGVIELVTSPTPGVLKESKTDPAYIVCFIGVLTMIVGNWPLGASSKISPFHPSSWENILHPSNYVLLASVWLLISMALTVASQHALSSISMSWAFGVLLLHFNMAYYVFESMSLPPPLSSDIGDEILLTTTHRIGEGSSTSTGDQQYTHDVVINGGGISGLFLACVLAKQNVRVLLCERRSKPISDARFAVLNSSSVEYMMDILDEDLFETLRLKALPEATHFGSMLLNGLGHSKARIFAAANSPSRETLMERLHLLDGWTESRTLGLRFASQLPIRIMQSHQEDVMKMQLLRYDNVDLRFGWIMRDFTMDEAGVNACIEEVNEDVDGNSDNNASGETANIRAKYIAGCDGPGSLVAKKMHFEFDGLLNLARTKSLLVKAPGLYEKVINTVGQTHQYQVIKKNFGLAAIVAADPCEDLWNFLFVFGDKAKNSPPEKVAKEFLGTNNFEIVQNRQWYWNFFVAAQFQKDRAFLVGDSAHSWPPFGGIGGNTAYGDAINLGWKLALACKGQGSDLLLQSYSVERRQQVLQTALYVLRVTPNPHLMKLLTSRAFYNSIFMPVVKAGWYHHNSGQHSSNHFSQGGIQFGAKLNFSPVIMREEIILPDDPSCKYIPSVCAGSRLPYLCLPGGQSIYSLLSTSGYTVFALDGELVNVAEEFANSIRTRLIPATTVVIPPLKPDAYEGTHKVVSDLLRNERMIVVRPDHVISWRLDNERNQEDQIKQGVSVLTGFDELGLSLQERYLASNDAHIVLSYQRWLTREFRFAQRPYRFRFPTSVPVNNVTKDMAIQHAKSSMKRMNKSYAFSTSTRQGEEKYDGNVSTVDLSSSTETSEPSVHPELSGFERDSPPKAVVIADLLKVAVNRKARGEPTFNFAVGNPSLNPPAAVLNQLARLAAEASTSNECDLFKYTHPGGLLELRKHIAFNVGQWQKSNIPSENIIITPGAQSGIVNIFEALLQKNDQILVQCPFYPDVLHAAEVWGATAKQVEFLDDFDVDIDNLKLLASQAGNRLRLISLCSPANPSGKVLSNETIQKICVIARGHSLKFGRDVWVFLDSTYWRLTYNGITVSPLFPHYEQSLIVSSFSKDLSLAGERIGYVAVNPASKHSSKLAQWITNNNGKLGNISPPSLMQHVLLSVYESNDKLPSLVDEYKERVILMHDRLNCIGLECRMPEGAFYLFARLPKGIQNDQVFAKKLADTAGVLVVPGSAFGAPGFVRFAALHPPNEINHACDLIQHALMEMSDADGRVGDAPTNINGSRSYTAAKE